MRSIKWWAAEFLTWIPSLIIACALIGTAAAAMPARTTTITATWSYDYTNFPACNSVMQDCISGFTFGEWNGSSCSNLKVVPNPLVPIGVVNGITAKVKVSGNVSRLKFCVVANYFDFTGAPQRTAAAIVNG